MHTFVFVCTDFLGIHWKIIPNPWRIPKTGDVKYLIHDVFVYTPSTIVKCQGPDSGLNITKKIQISEGGKG